MAEQRLSKLQKWIIINCFKVNVLLDRTGLKDLTNYECGSSFNKFECPNKIKKERTMYNGIANKCGSNYCEAFNLYKEDILLSYFNLEQKYKKYYMLGYRVEHFKGDKENNKAYVTLHRSLKNLWEKDLAYTWKPSSECSLQICLTDKGNQVAMQLLNIDPSTIIEPKLKSEEQCKKEQEENERAILRIKAMFSR